MPGNQPEKEGQVEQEHGIACGEVREILSPFLEGELAGEERSRVEGHLRTCESCRSDLDLLRHTVVALRELPELPPPAAILRGVREGMDGGGVRRRLAGFLSGWPRIGLPVGAAATLLVALGIALLYERVPEVRREPGSQRPSGTFSTAERADRAEPAGERQEEEDRERLMDEIAPAPPAEPAPALLPERKAARPAEDSLKKKAYKRAPPPPMLEEPEGEAPPPPGREPAAPPPDISPPPEDLDDVRTEADLPSGKVQAPPRALPEEPAAPSPGVRAPTEFRQDQPSSSPPSTKVETAAEDAERAPPPPPAVKTAKKKERREITRKSLPSREGAGKEEFAAPQAVLGLSGEMGAGNEGIASRQVQTEVLTIVSLVDGGEDRLRESLARTGGTLLEMTSLDSAASQRVALPHQNRLPRHQEISRGWQVRALLPLSQAEDFIDALERQPELQVLKRETVPSGGISRPGTQNFEINLIR